MNSNELRIGNFVLNEEGKYRQIIGLLSGQIIVLEENIPVGKKEELFEPVSLTPEILEKCGFEREKNNLDIFYIDIHNQGFLIYYLEQSITVVQDKLKNNFYPYLQLSTLHKLQNLYFTLTGEELKIQL